jgi:hypothetical protein
MSTKYKLAFPALGTNKASTLGDTAFEPSSAQTLTPRQGKGKVVVVRTILETQLAELIDSTG